MDMISFKSWFKLREPQEQRHENHRHVSGIQNKLERVWPRIHRCVGMQALASMKGGAFVETRWWKAFSTLPVSLDFIL